MNSPFYRVRDLDCAKWGRATLYSIDECRHIATSKQKADAELIVEALSNRHRYANALDVDAGKIRREAQAGAREIVRMKLEHLADTVTCDPFGVKARAIRWALGLI